MKYVIISITGVVIIGLVFGITMYEPYGQCNTILDESGETLNSLELLEGKGIQDSEIFKKLAAKYTNLKLDYIRYCEDLT